MSNRISLFVFAVFVLLTLPQAPLLQAQKSDSTFYNFGAFGGIIYLDSLTVTASRNGFDVGDFVRMVQEDKSFYAAFRNLRQHSYRSDNEIIMYGKSHKEKARLSNQVQQFSDGDCRSMTILKEEISGNFFKRKRRFRYYTGKMHDRIFLTHGRVCESQQKADPNPSGIEKHIRELKKLIFAPGEEVEVPIIGSRTAIFNKKMSPYYDYTIRSGKYKNGSDCYIFTAKVKPQYQHHKEKKTVIKYLETYFDKSQFQIIARKYQLKYDGSLFSFDINMQIDLTKKQEDYLPELIKYSGYWDVPAKKPERAEFTIHFYDFE